MMNLNDALETIKENLCNYSCTYGSLNMKSCDIKRCDDKDAIAIIEMNLLKNQPYKVLCEMNRLSYKYNIDFLITRYGMIVKKYFDYNGKPHVFSQAFPFDFLRNYDLEDMVLEFERRLELDMKKFRMRKESEEEEE